MSQSPYCNRCVASLVCLTFGTCLLPPAQALAEEKKPAAAPYMRLQRDDKKEPTALETSIVRFVPAAGEGKVVVDLVAVVHVGDKDYYRKLNKKFEDYDAVLYELVAPEGTRIPRGGKRDSDNPLAMVQQIVKIVLELELQTEQIDYQRKNFIHADLSPEEMAKAIKERGDTPLTLVLSVTADMLRQQNLKEMKKGKEPPKQEEADVDLADLLLDPNRGAKLKKMMAEQFTDNDAAGAFGQTISNILVADRNKAALKVLQKEIVKGKKKIAIFYGAAHMPDFEKRLKDDFGLKRDKEEWLRAWDLKAPPRGPADLLKLLLE